MNAEAQWKLDLRFFEAKNATFPHRTVLQLTKIFDCPTNKFSVRVDWAGTSYGSLRVARSGNIEVITRYDRSGNILH